jgi:putative transposase
VDQARRLKELEQENAKLKRLVSELSLEKLVLKDIALRTRCFCCNQKRK